MCGGLEHFLKTEKRWLNLDKSIEQEVLNICLLFRKAAQEISDERILDYFSAFPAGWCGTTSRALESWLKEQYPNEQFSYVCGYRNEASHAWIEWGELILDITADQFEDCDDMVNLVPLAESKFHKSFGNQRRRDITIWTDEREESLIYNRAKELFKTLIIYGNL